MSECSRPSSVQNPAVPLSSLRAGAKIRPVVLRSLHSLAPESLWPSIPPSFQSVLHDLLAIPLGHQAHTYREHSHCRVTLAGIFLPRCSPSNFSSDVIFSMRSSLTLLNTQLISPLPLCCSVSYTIVLTYPVWHTV